MEDYLRKQIHDILNLRETEDLQAIWQAANTDEYAEETFEIIQEILLQRLGTLPAQSVQFQAISRNPEVWFVSLPNSANTCRYLQASCACGHNPARGFYIPPACQNIPG